MKKVLSAMLLLALVFTLAIPAFADGDGPSFNEYYVAVTKLTGARMYEEKYSDIGNGSYRILPTLEVVPYNTIITVYGEYLNDDEFYLSVNYDSKYGLIKKEDVTLLVDSLPPEDGFKLSNKKTAYLYEETSIYKGPSEAYDKLSVKIPTDTIVTFEYVNNEYYSWAYVNYKGNAGWVYVYRYSQGNSLNGAAEEYDAGQEQNELNKFIVVKSGKALYKSPDSNSSKVVTDIPVGTELTYKYTAYNDGNVWTLHTCNGKSGWLARSDDSSVNAVAYGVKNSGIMVIDAGGVRMHASPRETSKIVGEVITKGTRLTSDYIYDDNSADRYTAWYRVSSNGQVGWVWSEDMVAVKTYCVLKVKKATVNVYAEPKTSSKVISTLSNGNIFNAEYCYYREGQSGIYHDWYYTTVNGVSGWVLNDDAAYYVESYVPITAVTSATVQATSAAASTAAVSSEQSTEAVDATTGASEHSSTPKKTVIACVGAAVAAALTAAVVIILVNKKKKDSAA